MADQIVLERIDRWLGAGFIDEATADRLRAAEAAAPTADRAGRETSSGASSRLTLPPLLGPAITVTEMFVYLGSGFLLGAYMVFAERITAGNGLAQGGAWLLVAVAFAAIGLFLLRGDARRRRAAGVAFAVACGAVGMAASEIADQAQIAWPLHGVVTLAAATVAAAVARVRHAAVLTQATLLTAATILAVNVLGWLRWVVTPVGEFGDPVLAGRPDPVLLVAASAAWWLGIALLLGLLAARERQGSDPLAGRRAALTALWAGLTAVVGVTEALFRSDYLATDTWGRVVEPWVAGIVLLALAAILLERGLRSRVEWYVISAGLALIIALTDFNFAYLSSSREVGFLVEGLILLGAGVATDRVRRRIVGRGSPSVAPA
jgi:hypothetical protein